MLKKIGLALAVVLLLLAIIAAFGVRHFNNLWFVEKSINLTYTTDYKPINFRWSGNKYSNYVEPHEAILIHVKIEGFAQKFHVQFDTGAPSTIIYGNPLKSLQALNPSLKDTVKNDKRLLQRLEFTLGGSHVNATMIEVLEGYGRFFGSGDTIKSIKLATIGADFLFNRVTSIDFKNKTIQLHNQRPDWMATLPKFKPFSFEGRRFMLPAKINGKKINLLYDSGCSAFGLITSKNRYDDYTDKNEKEITYEGNRFGESLTIHHKKSKANIEIGNANLDLKRISYVNIYADFQGFLAPFSKIGGWLGNKPFIESTLILDTQKEEFIVIIGK